MRKPLLMLLALSAFASHLSAGAAMGGRDFTTALMMSVPMGYATASSPGSKSSGVPFGAILFGWSGGLVF